jgi:hypothetical protein
VRRNGEIIGKSREDFLRVIGSGTSGESRAKPGRAAPSPPDADRDRHKYIGQPQLAFCLHLNLLKTKGHLSTTAGSDCSATSSSCDCPGSPTSRVGVAQATSRVGKFASEPVKASEGRGPWPLGVHLLRGLASLKRRGGLASSPSLRVLPLRWRTKIRGSMVATGSIMDGKISA